MVNQAIQIYSMHSPLEQSDLRLNKVADLLLSSGGVFAYLADTFLPKWEILPLERPPDVLISVPRALSKFVHFPAFHINCLRSFSLCLGQAQEIAIEKALLRNNSMTLITKLAAEVATCFATAQQNLLTMGAEYSALSEEFRYFVAGQVDVAQAVTLKYRAMDHSEKVYVFVPLKVSCTCAYLSLYTDNMAWRLVAFQKPKRKSSRCYKARVKFFAMARKPNMKTLY